MSTVKYKVRSCKTCKAFPQQQAAERETLLLKQNDLTLTLWSSDVQHVAFIDVKPLQPRMHRLAKHLEIKNYNSDNKTNASTKSLKHLPVHPTTFK